MQFSNDDRDVFIVKIERMIDRGALLSRYSRAANLDIREVYRKEFEGNENRGKEFYKRVFLEYGDESIAELVTVQMAIQNLSNVMTKTIEELRVGLSFLEKSSRYVRYDRKKDGKYLFLSPERAGIPQSLHDSYSRLCDRLFDFYASSYEPAIDFFTKKYPLESILFTDSEGKPCTVDQLSGKDREDAEKSYKSSIRARALDDLRYLLPAATVTNLGISGNGRSFINLIQKLLSTGVPEAKKLADDIYNELELELPELIDSAVSDHGKRLIQYKKELDSFRVTEGDSPGPIAETVELLDSDSDGDALHRSLSILTFANGQGDVKSAMDAVAGMTVQDLCMAVEKLASLRKNRRHKLHRAFEAVPYLFQITTNYGAFRDLQRHRFISINRQPLSVGYGFDVPEFFAESGFNGEYTSLMDEVISVYSEISSAAGRHVAQYVVPYAFRYPVTAHLNLREAAFFCELRSTPQAHPDLRKIAVDMYHRISEVNPSLAPLIKFVDQDEYALGRLKSEQRKERKMRDIGDRTTD